MDRGTMLLILILVAVALIIVDVSWYRSYHLGQLSHYLGRMLSGLR